MGKQEYLYNGEYVTIFKKVEGDKDLVVVSNDHEELIVAHKSNLQKKEDSWGYQRSLERKKELQSITADAQARFDELVDEVVDKAISALSLRMKMNTLFAKDMNNASGWAIQIVSELEKLIKEKAPETVKGKGIFD